MGLEELRRVPNRGVTHPCSESARIDASPDTFDAKDLEILSNARL
jgi:hypothetical protein